MTDNQGNAPEAATEASTTETPVAPTLSEKYSAITSALSELRTFDAAEAARSKAVEEANRLRTIQEQLKNPDTRWNALQALGLNPQDLQPPAPASPEVTLQNEIQALRQELNDLKGVSKQTARDRVLDQTKQAVYSYLDGNDKFPGINGYGQEAKDLVYQTMVQSFERDGVLRSEEEVAQEIEQSLNKHYQTLAAVFGDKPKPQTGLTLNNALVAIPGKEFSYNDLPEKAAKELFRQRFAEALKKTGE